MSSRIFAVALALTLLTLSGCGNDAKSPEANKGPEPSQGKKLKLAFITNNASDFWTIAKKGVQKAEGEFSDVTVDFLMPSEASAAGQKRLIDDELAKGVDGIAISPVSPANQTEMLNAIAKQAVLLTQDSDAPESDRVAYVGTDNQAAGKLAGAELMKALPNGGKVMVFVGDKGAQNAKDRIAGLREAIQGSKIEIIDVRTDETDHAKAKANVADTLVKYPDVAALVGIWSYNGPAILNATKEANELSTVKIVCFDEEDETLAGVKAGEIEATIVQQPFEFGYQSVKLMRDIKSGKQDAAPANKMQIIPTLVITKDKVDEFATKLKGLRGR